MATSPKRAPTGSDELADSTPRTLRILVVDDVRDNLDLLTDLFASEPWNVRTADNAKDAWALMKRWHPDLVLLDIHMPNIDGHALYSAIVEREEFTDVPVVFLTAERTSRRDIERGLALGVVDYLCKPIDGKQLRQRVRAILQGDRFPAAT